MAGGRPINIEINTDVDGVIKGAEKVADSFEEVQDSLKDVAKASDRAANDIESDLKGTGKVVDRDLTKPLDEALAQAKATGKGIGKSVKDGTDKAGDGMKELGDESKSTAREAAASFGSIEDGADALQEVLANAFAGFGPAGMAAGALAAVGLGLAITAMQEGADKATAMQEAAVGMAEKIEEAGGRIEDVDIASIISEWGREVTGDNWLTPWANEATTNFQKVAKQAEEAGVKSGDAIRGMKGSAEDSKGFLDGTQKEWDELNKTVEAGTTITEFGAQALDASAQSAKKKRDALGDLRKGAQENLDTTKEGMEIYKLEQGAVEGTTEAYKKKADAIEKVTDATKDSISAEHEYLESVEGLDAALAENGATLDRNTKAGRENEKAALDSASAIESKAKADLEAGVATDVVTAKFQAQKDVLVNQLLPAFGGNRAAAQAYVDTILKVPGNVKTDVILNDQAARNALDNLTKARTAPLQILPDGSAVERWYMSQQGRKIFVEFAPKGGGQAASMP